MFREIQQSWQRRRPSLAVGGALLAVLLVAVVAAMVYATGGTRYVYAHAAYVPIVIAGLAIGPWGGIGAGILAGLSLGPLMPLDVAAGEMQGAENWLFRIVFFVGTGTVIGVGSQMLRRLAQTDAVSGMPNRAALEARLDRRAVVSWADRPSTLVMLRLNALQAVSSMLSRGQLRSLWRQIGQRLGEALPADGHAFAVCSDQVAILLPAKPPGHDRAWAERLVAGMRQPFRVGEVPLDLEPCAGIAHLVHRHSDDDFGPIMLASDCAHRAYLSGRPVEEEVDEAVLGRRRTARLLGELPEAMLARRLDHHYQPKVVLADGRVSGVEALLRWHHPVDGLILPGHFLPAVERTGLIEPLTWYALERACRQAVQWRRQGIRSLSVAVNLSARNLLQEGFVERAVDIVAAAGEGLTPGDVELEVTESAVMEAPADAIGTLRRLRAAGFGVAIDDFGSGQSSLSYLARLPATTLKLDRSLVQAMGGDARAASVVAMVVQLAGEFGMRVVAEGLEAPEAAGLLMEIGCHEVQGFLLARPMPAAAFEDWLAVEAPQLAMRLFAMRLEGAA